jgi:hypothetical protein
MKQLLAWTGSADSTITSEAIMAMAEKFNTGQEAACRSLARVEICKSKSAPLGQTRRAATFLRKDGLKPAVIEALRLTGRAHASLSVNQATDHRRADAVPQIADMSGDTGTVADCIRARSAFV